MTDHPCPNHVPNPRLALLNSLVSAGPGKPPEIEPIHEAIERLDAHFYARLAAWYCDHGAATVHREIFLARLILSQCAARREIGLALLRRLSPGQVAGVVDYIHGRKKTRKVIAPAAPVKSSLAGRIARWIKPLEAKSEPKLKTESFGLFRNPPRSLRTEIARYLREREADADRFDWSVMDAPKAMKRLYALNHIKPGERAQRVLFHRNPPPESLLFARRLLAKAHTPSEQVRTIALYAIPYWVAASVLTPMNPSVLCAMIEKMTPAELSRQMPCLRRQGAMENAYLKGRIERKLEHFQPADPPGPTLVLLPLNPTALLAEIEDYPVPQRKPVHL